MGLITDFRRLRRIQEVTILPVVPYPIIWGFYVESQCSVFSRQTLGPFQMDFCEIWSQCLTLQKWEKLSSSAARRSKQGPGGFPPSYLSHLTQYIVMYLWATTILVFYLEKLELILLQRCLKGKAGCHYWFQNLCLLALFSSK